MRPSSYSDQMSLSDGVFYFLKSKTQNNNRAPSVVSITLKVMRDTNQLYGRFSSALEVKEIDRDMHFYINAASLSIPENSCLKGKASANGNESTIQVETLNLPDSSTVENIDVIYKEPLSLSYS